MSLCPVIRLPEDLLLFLYLYSIVLILEMITININITSVGFQRHNAFIPTLGSGGPQWGPVEFMCVSVCLSICLYVCSSVCLYVTLSVRLHRFLSIMCTARNCAQRMRTQDTGSNTLNGSIICSSVHLSVRLSGRPLEFCNFCICIKYFKY